MNLRQLFFTFLLFLYSQIYSQFDQRIPDNSNQKFEEFTSKDGLRHHSITYVSQDHKGYMWFGTYNGIYKYDGYNFNIYKNDGQNENSLIENNINVIKEDSSGNVWIGTKGGLCIYNRALNNFQRKLNVSKKEFQIKDEILSIWEARNLSIWIGTNNGLYNLVKQNNDWIISKKYSLHNKTSKLETNYIKSISEDFNGNLLIGTRKGLFVLKENLFVRFSTHPLAVKHNIRTIFNTSKDTIWFGTRQGLHRICKQQGDAFKIDNISLDKSNTKKIITTICKDLNHSIWVGTKNNGIYHYSTKMKSFKNYRKNILDENSLSSNEITSIYEDKKGVLWIGSIGGHLKKLDLQKKNILHFKNQPHNLNSLSDNVINIIYEDSKEQIWVGTVNGGLNKISIKNSLLRIDKLKPSLNINKALNSKNIFSFCEDNYGNYWAGTENKGLNHITFTDKNQQPNIKQYSKNNSTSSLPTNNITSLFKDHKGDIWMGSFDIHGLMKFTPKKTTNTPIDIIHYSFGETSIKHIVSCFYEDPNKQLWVGTYGGGLYKVLRDKNNNPIQILNIKNIPEDKESLSNNNVFSIHEDKFGNLWLGTFGGGLNKISLQEKSSEKPKIKSYQIEQGLPNNELYGILEDSKGNLWISSNNGISKFNTKTEVFTNFNINDGLQDSNFRKLAYCKGKNGIMYFGGINGFNAFYPDSFKDNTYEPLIEIVDLKIFNKTVPIGKEILGKKILSKSISETNHIELTHKHNSFSIAFSALHYASSKQNKFAYQLEGFDKEWVFTDANRRYALYSNLNPGNYIFRVKASNNDNLWSTSAKEITIKILPPWWKTWWAYTIYVIILVLLLLLFKKVIVTKEDYQNKIKIEKIEQEKIKEINKTKLEFFTNISHEFKTPLTLILGPLQNVLDQLPKDSKFKESLIMMERNAKHLYKLIIQVMEFRMIETKELQLKLSNGDLVDFCKNEVFTLKTMADAKDLSLRFDCNNTSFENPFDWDKLKKIINNLVSNSIKYTPKEGQIKVSLSVPNQNSNKEESYISIQVSDTGKGIPKNQLALIFDRFYKIDNEDRSSNLSSGIGLAYTKSLVELCNGTITVDSLLNQGSTFTVKIPLSKDNILLQAKNNIDIPKETFTTNISDEYAETKSYDAIITREELPTLLIVEDNYDMQLFIEKTLKAKFNIFLANDGLEGLKIAKKELPDIIISDIMMPNMDGIAFCNEIKTNFITNHIPIVLLTARASVEHKIEGLKVGADAYIPKPFHAEHLKEQLNNLLKQRKSLKEKFSSTKIPFNSQVDGIKQADKDFLEKAEMVIDNNLTNEQFGVEEFGEQLGLSRMQVYRKLKSIRGSSANDFIREYRLKKAANLLKNSNLNVTEISFEIGFTNRSYFTKCFKDHFGVSPREFIKNKES